MRAYFGGLLVFSALMMFLLPSYFVYVITSFIHAYLLRPAPLAFLGVGLTSVIINSRIVYPDPTADEWVTFAIIVVIQTVAVGFGIIGGGKIAELSEQRQRSVVQLEAALEENAGLHAQLVVQAREAGINDERQRIAGEIHDTIAQGLTGVITQLGAASRVKTDPMELQRGWTTPPAWPGRAWRKLDARCGRFCRRRWRAVTSPRRWLTRPPAGRRATGSRSM